MTKPVLALSLAALAVFGWSLPVAHSAPPAAAAARQRVALEVDVDELPQAERGVASVVLEHMRELIEGGGYEVAPEAETVLRVRLRQLEAGDANYGIHFEFVEGDVVEPATEWTDCVFCTEARLLQKLDATEEALLKSIAERQAAGSSDDGGGETGGEETGGDEGGDGDGDVGKPVKPIGALGGAGIGVAVVGIGVTIGGAVQWSRGRVPNDDITSMISEGRDYTGQGQLLVGIGVGAVVVGAVMLGVDVGLRAKRQKAPRAHIVPTLSGKHAGISITGRF